MRARGLRWSRDILSLLENAGSHVSIRLYPAPEGMGMGRVVTGCCPVPVPSSQLAIENLPPVLLAALSSNRQSFSRRPRAASPPHPTTHSWHPARHHEHPPSPPLPQATPDRHVAFHKCPHRHPARRMRMTGRWVTLAGMVVVQVCWPLPVPSCPLLAIENPLPAPARPRYTLRMQHPAPRMVVALVLL